MSRGASCYGCVLFSLLFLRSTTQAKEIVSDHVAHTLEEDVPLMADIWSQQLNKVKKTT